MADTRAPISSSRIATGDIAKHTFATVRRGYDADEVRAYLQSVARSVQSLEEHEQELRTALADAEERAAHPVIDESTLTASLGQHSAQILRHAHEEAARIVAQAQEGAASMLREAHRQVEDLQTRTEASTAERVGEVELLVANAENEARAERDRILAQAAAERDAVAAKAKEEGRSLLEQVQEARRRVLADLAARRRQMGVQIEQLRAARDEMATSVLGVRDKVDAILVQLQRTDEEARAAAIAVGDQARLHGGPATEAYDQDASEREAEEAGSEHADAATSASAGDKADWPATTEDAGSAGHEAEASVLSSPPSVDELFARIRAGSGPDAAATAGAGQPEATKADAASDAGTAAHGEGKADGEAKADGADGAGEADGDGDAGPDAVLAARRDDLLGPVTARLTRSVKRALGDDQNRLLDALRSSSATSDDAVVGNEEQHVAGYAAAARGHLAEAFAAGVTFAGGDPASVAVGDTVEQATAGLAHSVVSSLRRRIAEGGDDMSDRVGVAFREWRGERVESVVGDYATQTFSAAVRATAGDEQPVRWVLTAAGCSDCDDNVLAGDVAKGDTFPTGHAHPPAHPGCRCLITTESA
jgi:DivIVA domain-containing protein